MSSEQSHESDEYLTVPEAARVLRIGRTKAYALTQQWRESGGRSGLPVVDLGSVLRIPRRGLDQLINASLVVPPPSASTPVPSEPADDDVPSEPATPVRSRKHHRNANQLDLFDLPPAS